MAGNSKLSYLFILFALLVCSGISSQPTISGASCILPGGIYQYDLGGFSSDSTSVQVCISGGKWLDSIPDLCKTNINFQAVRIIWDDTTIEKSLTVTSNGSSKTIRPNTTHLLNGGSIDTTLNLQFVIADSIPHDIVCTNAAGGDCAPLYSYQWQSSDDGDVWADMPGMTNKDLSFTNTLLKTTNFRRKVTEINSNNIEYSNSALIIIVTHDAMQ